MPCPALTPVQMRHPPPAAWSPGGQQAKFSNGVVAAVLFIPLVIT